MDSSDKKQISYDNANFLFRVKQQSHSMTALDHSTNTGPILQKAIPDSGINLKADFVPAMTWQGSLRQEAGTQGVKGKGSCSKAAFWTKKHTLGVPHSFFG